MGLYPLFADLAGREVLVVGGGEVAARKIAALLRAGADVRLHTRDIGHPDIQAAVDEGRITCMQGEFDPAWLDGVWLVVAATDDHAFNAGLATEAGRRRRLINVVDDAALSTYQMPAVVDRSPLVVAISSAGAAPMLARRIRERLETLLDPATGALAGLFARHRERIRTALPDLSLRRRWFETILDGRLDAVAGDPGALEATFLAELDAAGARGAVQGSVSAIAAVEPDLLTLRALRALNEADLILVGPGVRKDALEPARRDASRVDVASANEGAGLAASHAREGERVVYLYVGSQAGGETAPVEAACANAGVAFRSIPGVPMKIS